MTLRVSCVSGRSPAGCQEKKAAKKVLVELSFVWKSERILNFSPPKELGDRASELHCRLGAAVCAGGRGQSPLRAGGLVCHSSFAAHWLWTASYVMSPNFTFLFYVNRGNN